MLAAAGWEGRSSTWTYNAETGEQRILPQVPMQGDWGRSVDVSSDGQLIAGEGQDNIFIWSARDGRILERLPEQLVAALAFSPDGQRLASGSLDGDLIVWDARTGGQLASLSGPPGQILDLAFAPDGTHLATTSSDGTVRLWDMATGRQALTLASDAAGEVGAQTKFCFRTYRGAYEGVGGKLAFSPDGTRLGYTAADGTVRVLALDIDDVLNLARSRLTRSWTQAECETYLHLDTCPTT
jgi:WD40 repeat protein